jgi:hypothetical protein
MIEKNIHRISVRIPLHQVNALERTLIETGQTYSEQIRQLIESQNRNLQLTKQLRDMF